MKRVLIEKVKPVPLPKAYKQEWGTTAQRIQIEADDMLLLDIYIKGTYTARHCVNIESGEYATWFAASDGFSSPYPMVGQDAIWTGNKISYPYTNGKYYDSYDFDWNKKWKEVTKLAGKKNEEVVKTILDEAKQDREKEQLKGRYSYTFPAIPTLENWRVYFSDLESKYSSDKRILAEDRRIKRVNDVMDMVPEIPDEFGEWVYGQMFDGVPGEALYEVSTKKWVCSECHSRIDRDNILDEKGSRVKANKVGFCPVCGEKITLHRKTKQYDKTIRYSMKACMFNAIGDSIGVVRYFDAEAWSSTRQQPEDPKGKNIDIMETIRIVLPKLNNAGQQIRKVLLKKKDAECRIYYRDFHGFFDYKSNPMHRYTGKCVCYPNGEITKALEWTVYEVWSRVFEKSAAMGMQIDYNRCMIGYQVPNIGGVSEMLFKGRFYKLFNRLVDCIDTWKPGRLNEWNKPCIDIGGKNAYEVLQLADGQNINRLRDMDGDINTLKWLRWTERNNRRISQEALLFLTRHDISIDNVSFVSDKMSPEQIMNYLKRQQATSYPGMRISNVLDQWADYMKMAKDLKKKTDDEMIYKPRELKLRHDEYVAECNRKRQLIQARHDREYAKEQVKKYNKKFPKAKSVLKRVKAKLEWENDEYIIKVPKELTEIILEGQQLHHCAGATDRYFDRIEQEETYICFLRRKDHPKEPFYTIEVEPGGTIRQHRGMYDEEPEIEKVKPALREWQKEIKRRMKEEDKKKAEVSKRKRAENILDLEKKNNTRVLKGLMEDLMDIEDLEAETKDFKEVVNG